MWPQRQLGVFGDLHRGRGAGVDEGRKEIRSGWGQTGKGGARWGWSTSELITWALEGLCKDFNFHSDRNREQLWVLNRRMMQSH